MAKIGMFVGAVVRKLSSRKLLVTLGSIAAGACMMRSGDITQGAALIGTAAVGYLAAEGLVDARRVHNIAEAVSEATAGGTTGAPIAQAGGTAEQTEAPPVQADKQTAGADISAVVAEAVLAALKAAGVTK